MSTEFTNEILFILFILSIVGQAAGQDAALPASASAKASPFAKASAVALCAMSDRSADKSADRQAGVPGAAGQNILGSMRDVASGGLAVWLPGLQICRAHGAQHRGRFVTGLDWTIMQWRACPD
jgi:hypothetical protein